MLAQTNLRFFFGWFDLVHDRMGTEELNRLGDENVLTNFAKPIAVAQFAGDFFVVDLANDSARLEVVLVDVCGKGVQAGTQSLQLAGAMGGLIGALPPLGLFAAANDYLLRQNWNDGFATAVHIMVDLQQPVAQRLGFGFGQLAGQAEQP